MEPVIYGTYGCRCFSCGKVDLVTMETEFETIHVDQRFITTVTADVCPACGDRVVDERTEELVSLASAQWLLLHRTPTGPVVRFARRSIELTQVDLAQLLDLTEETLSRIENGAQRLSVQAVALMVAMLTEAATGETRTIDTLRTARVAAITVGEDELVRVHL